ncbi:unnamed protein product (macronuclear) [Paramecium tetraurelia]|uniref:Uncharacterized protein n=1 Tax=Paramecium tetraurelia TaxID=5888 RepID=A0DYM2_PARTE|nr:uncharacterized protein GSPATT00003107001 [Paramecium tetraurelia]CAK88139.1 unnamed protein product [Paramecium tetraurelia]|eukprot:XP_001455536.1 hypothetical protein (macronuclear) [Paramecium tetraurelia strain d4-2]
MGVAQTCLKQRNSAPQIEYKVPTILRRKQIVKHPHKQNILIPPLSQLGEYHESLEQLELALQENNINLSIHKTATFNSSSANRQSISINPSLNLSLNTTIPNMIQPQINQNLSIQEQPQPQHKNEQIVQRRQTYKDSQFKIRAEVQCDKNSSYARSLSSNSRAQKAQNANNEESSISLKRDSETNTKKSILKNKQQIITNQLKRGISLRQQQQIINEDTQSQRTSKSQKRVKFDPKIFRPKNTHFFQ